MIKLLVLPDLFPSTENPLKGIFIIDYLKSVEKYCDITIFYNRVFGQKKGLVEEKDGEISIYRNNISDKKSSKFTKAFLYFRWYLSGLKICTKLFKETDVIHSHGTILNGLLGLLLSKKIKKPLIISEHSGPFSMNTGSFLNRRITKYILERADRVLVVSNHLKNEILNENILPKEITISYNPVDTELFTLENNVQTKTMVFTNRLDENKGALRTLKAFHQLQLTDWKLIIIGNGKEYEILNEYLNQNLELKSQVQLTGYLSKPEIAEVYKTASFFMLPTEFESFGLANVEALAAGLPVITGNKTAMPEYMNHENGIMINATSIDEIADAMQTMIQNIDSYDCQKIRNQVVERFSFDAFGERLHSIYQDVLCAE